MRSRPIRLHCQCSCDSKLDPVANNTLHQAQCHSDPVHFTLASICLGTILPDPQFNLFSHTTEHAELFMLSAHGVGRIVERPMILLSGTRNIRAMLIRRIANGYVRSNS